ncbi:MAG TPA: hypothetical protein VJT49_22970 [Amycolatopsis sp.]|uniref:hypothetical protein n=1 Tax=Amycolatopsis sp. TaxID=37632 RepID=UPI002B470253|nr:hypothetical protein [Amycolatopsis sp.]HKS47919.1 hypothetical protein [Amycolatopsis sp.]
MPLSRIWELRDTLTTYDAAYAAAAELLDAPDHPGQGLPALEKKPVCAIRSIEP